MKKISRRIIVAIAVLLAIFATTLSVQTNVYADPDNEEEAKNALSQDDIKIIKQNIFFKSIYMALYSCYGKMQNEIKQEQTAVWADFNSKTYWQDEALEKDYLHFPFGVGQQNKSSCPDLITGWKNNIITNLFTKTGNFAGLLKANENAEVPGEVYYAEDNYARMENFLLNIGYAKNGTEDGTMDGYKCFYIKATITNFVQRTSNGYGASTIPKPKSGNFDFETVDFCTKDDSDGYIEQSDDGIKYLFGHSGYGSQDDNGGHLTETSNVILFQFQDCGYAPCFKNNVKNKNYGLINLDVGDWNGATYLEANLISNHSGNPISLWYFSEDYDNTHTAVNIKGQHLKTESDFESCKPRGYVDCIWYEWWGDNFVASLTEPNDKITHNQFKARMVNIVGKMAIENPGDIFTNVSAKSWTPTIFKYNRGSNTDKFINYFLINTDEYNNSYMTPKERYMLYYYYLTEKYDTIVEDNNTVGNAILVDWLMPDGTFAQKYIYMGSSKANHDECVLMDFEQGSLWSPVCLRTEGWEYIANQLAKIDAKTAFDGIYVSVVDENLDVDFGESDDTSDVTDGSDDVNCYTAGGSLGWVLCPILNFLTETVNSIYDSVVEPYLRMDVALLNPNDDAGKATLEGWKTFQGIANILLVIFFIVIIASQLTGIGISNYGIKKSLPKIIVAAVLINLSFIICQLAVDASNIVGSSVKALFDSMGKEIAISSIKYGEAADPVPVNTTGMNIVAGAVGILATLVFGAAALYIYGAAILIPLIVGALSVFISIFFVFILLSIRKAAVIILTAISPLAFAMYMLPNTKRLFDKWLKAFEGLLLLYPIAGALIGGGNFASRLLLMSGTGEYDFFFALSAMIIGIVPIFFIPSLLKHSFAAMGNIGAKISGIGAGASRRAGRSVRDSQWARGLNEDQMRTMARRRSGLKADGTLSMRGKAQNKRLELADKARSKNKVLGGIAGVALGASAGSQRRLNNMRANTLENIAKDGNNEYIGEGSEDAIANRKAAADAEREAREVKDIETSIVNSGDGNNEKKLQDNLTDAIRTGDAKKIKAYQNVLSRKGESGREAVRQAMIEAEKTGDVSAESRKIYSNNIIDNWSKDYKDNARSTYDYAMANTSGAGESMANYEAKSAEKITQNQMAQMDETELQRYIDNMKSGKLSQSDAVALYETASGACSNKDIIASTKASQRAKMQQLMHIYEATRPHKSNSNPDGSNENNNGSSAGANANESNNSSNPNGSSTQSEAKPNGNT